MVRICKPCLAQAGQKSFGGLSGRLCFAPFCTIQVTLPKGWLSSPCERLKLFVVKSYNQALKHWELAELGGLAFWDCSNQAHPEQPDIDAEVGHAIPPERLNLFGKMLDQLRSHTRLGSFAARQGRCQRSWGMKISSRRCP